MKNIKIKINILTYISIVLFLYSGYKSLIIPIFLVFLIHEMGHIFFCKIFNIRIISLEIYPFGGILKVEKMINIEIYKDVLISLGGIIFQLLLYIFNFAFIRNSMISYYNYLFMILNILPIVPFDGSRLYLNIISTLFPYYYSILLQLFTSTAMLLSFSVFQIYNQGFNLFYAIFSLSYLIAEFKNIKHVMNQFFLERYLYNFCFKKSKYYNNKNLNLLQRRAEGFFFDNTYINERILLSKKFDNSSYIW